MSIVVLDGAIKLGGLDACRFYYHCLKEKEGATKAAVKAFWRSMTRTITLTHHEIGRYMVDKPGSVVTKKIQARDISMPLPFPFTPCTFNLLACVNFFPKRKISQLYSFLRGFCAGMGRGYTIDKMRNKLTELNELILKANIDVNKMNDQWCTYENGKPKKRSASDTSKIDENKYFNLKSTRLEALSTLKKQVKQAEETLKDTLSKLPSVHGSKQKPEQLMNKGGG